MINIRCLASMPTTHSKPSHPIKNQPSTVPSLHLRPFTKHGRRALIVPSINYSPLPLKQHARKSMSIMRKPQCPPRILWQWVSGYPVAAAALLVLPLMYHQSSIQRRRWRISKNIGRLISRKMSWNVRKKWYVMLSVPFIYVTPPRSTAVHILTLLLSSRNDIFI